MKNHFMLQKTASNWRHFFLIILVTAVDLHQILSSIAGMKVGSFTLLFIQTVCWFLPAWTSGVPLGMSPRSAAGVFPQRQSQAHKVRAVGKLTEAFLSVLTTLCEQSTHMRRLIHWSKDVYFYNVSEIVLNNECWGVGQTAKLKCLRHTEYSLRPGVRKIWHNYCLCICKTSRICFPLPLILKLLFCRSSSTCFTAILYELG